MLLKSSYHKGYDIQDNQKWFEIGNVTRNLQILICHIKSLEKPEEDVINGRLELGYRTLQFVTKNSFHKGYDIVNNHVL